MKKWILVLAACVAVLSGAAYGVWRWQWHTAYLSALDAYRRAYDYRDASVLLYEPRLKDFETAEDELARLPSPNPEASITSEELRQCADSLKHYRESVSFVESLNPREVPEALIDSAMNSSVGFGNLAGSCIRNAAGNGDI